MQSGQEMLEETVAVCRQIADGLAGQDESSQTWEDSVTEIVDKFGEISGTFFFKTMPSVPVTRKCLRDAKALLDLRDQGSWTAFGPATEALIVSAQTVIEKAGMKGTVLT